MGHDVVPDMSVACCMWNGQIVQPNESHLMPEDIAIAGTELGEWEKETFAKQWDQMPIWSHCWSPFRAATLKCQIQFVTYSTLVTQTLIMYYNIISRADVQFTLRLAVMTEIGREDVYILRCTGFIIRIFLMYILFSYLYW